jgi:acetylornithine deacetylase/succinyl-diaminopimelate desuccinylase-like protein
MTTAELTGETVELLQQLIRNECVNDGTPESGQEARSADVLTTYLEGGGLDVESYEPTPGRRSVVARIEGTDPAAPRLCLMGHTDVVPVSPEGWRRDPFGGELVDGEVWGRGALDMLNLTASMAVAVKHLARSGWRPKGTLIYFGVADEEAGGVHGAEWLVDHEWDALACDYVVTESGGWSVHGPHGQRVVITVGEKGVAWRRLIVRGTPGHGSMPYGADNALITTAEVVRRLDAFRPAAQIDEIFQDTVAHLDLPDDVRAGLNDPATIDEALARVPEPSLAKVLHAGCHPTISPNVVHGGVKTNVIPDEIVLDVDIRTLPGQSDDDIDRLLADALGPDLAARVRVEHLHGRPSTQSPLATPLHDALARLTAAVYPDAALVPRRTAGGTDATFFRGKGAVAYGFGLFSRSVTWQDFASRFHGHDERIDVESLELTTQCWLALCRDLLDG